ncbi:MAG TPA: sigma-70 family RNA polymerase sigma factor [Isosphaeraceae bacterium]|jgi:RNA polymerase sigma factor (sigma-70 family)|nr:sigma-70 family RNA polymerase sigma factor [Isosphaeraceae bacterium]
MDHDTTLGGREQRFPLTHRSLIAAAASAEPARRQQALEAIIAGYWKPVYKYIRIKWSASNEDAKDLAQAFFARAMEKGFLERYDPAKAQFRTYLRTCVDGFVANERKAAGRIKRGGQALLHSLDFSAADDELRLIEVADPFDADDFFRQEWIRDLFAVAVEALRLQCEENGKATAFAIFERLDLDAPNQASKPSYVQLAEELNLPVTQVNNFLAYARREFRRLVLERLRESTGDDAEYRAEAQSLLGVDPP